MEVIEVKKNFARAKLLRVLKPSPERVEPACRYFAGCGGCQYQHMDYAAQLRHEAQAGHGPVRTHRQDFAGERRCRWCRVRSLTVTVQRIMIRSQWNKPEQETEHRLRARGLRPGGGHRGMPDRRAGVERADQTRAGRPAAQRAASRWCCACSRRSWEVARDSFFQNNFFLLPQLVETARGCLKAGGVKHLLDLYCGVGFFGIELADAVRILCRGGIRRAGDQVRAAKSPRRGT